MKTCYKLSVGLLGGSFDPPHEGHRHISVHALKRFDLDQIWWLVSPGNPIKHKPHFTANTRFGLSCKLADHPQIYVTEIESIFDVRYTFETLQLLLSKFPQFRFVWLMGSDNLAEFHTWNNWFEIAHHVSIGVLARTGYRMQARNSIAARSLGKYWIPEHQAQLLATSIPPSWTLVNIPMHPANSTKIRASIDL